MVAEPMLIHFPVALYNRLKLRAEQSHRSLESEVLETIAAALPIEQDLAPELEHEVSQLALLDDKALTEMIHAQFDANMSARLERLHLKREEKVLTSKESATATELAFEMEKFMFLRAQAISLLMQRGHDVASLLQNE